MADQEALNTDTKQEIKGIINSEIEKNKSDLTQVKCCIERKYRRSLGTIDKDYIERKFIKYCVKAWLAETTYFLKTLTASQSRNVIQEILNSVNEIRNLKDIPNSFKQREFYVLLMKHQAFVKEKVEKTAINRFRIVCFAQIDSVEKEVDFLEAFVRFLNSSTNLLSIIAELKFEDVYCRNLKFSEFIILITNLNVSTYGESLAALQDAVKCLQTEGGLLLMDKFKEIVGAYMKPVQVQEKEMDNRSVIEVSGISIVISKILRQLEQKLSRNPKIEEVHFVGAHTIHIDANVEGKIWQGRNIVIITKLIQIHNKATWNVSGKDNDHEYYWVDAGTGVDGHGKQGKDGYPGESGGNVLLLVDKIENPENFTIVSNGGKGSKGQNGGDGRDGRDGTGITKEEFEQNFPPVAKLSSKERRKNLTETVRNIKKDLQYVKAESCGDAEFSLFTKVVKEVILETHLFSEGDMYMNAIINHGNEIIFSYQSASDGNNCQAYLLYKGSLGEPGGNGGKCGLGGQGGYPGEVSVSNLEGSQDINIKRETMQGKEGENGRGGLYGNHGTNGWDMGYMDYSVSGFFTETWPKYFGTNEKNKLSLEFYRNNSSKNVWCSYNERYVEIIASRIEHKKQIKYEERQNVKQNSDRQHHAQAVRKNGNSTKSILANYSHHLNFMDCTLQNLRSEIDSTQQLALGANRNQNQEQQDRQSVEKQRKRNVSFFGQNKSERIHNTINFTSDAMNGKQKSKELIEELLNEQILSDKWFKVECVELSIFQLSQLFDALKIKISKKHDSQDESKLKNVEKLLIDKYRLATLQEISRQLPCHPEITDKTRLTAEAAVRYLVQGKEKYNNISHPILGTLNQYLYQNRKEQRENIIKFCEESARCEELQNPIKEALKRSIKAFVFEVQESGEAYASIKRCHNDFEKFNVEKDTETRNSYEKIQKELEKSKHDGAYTLWTEYNSGNKSVRYELEQKIKENKIVCPLYKCYNDQLDLEYDWSECYKDPEVLKNYNDCIRRKGSLSKCCRELLTHVFNVNIRLYAKDQQNQLSLQGNLNPSSEKAVYVLHSTDELIQLDFNENYFVLEAQRKENDKLYGKILKEIKGFEQKPDFDDYFKSKSFLYDDNRPESKQDFIQEHDIKQILKYFPEEEQQQLKPMLENMSLQYVDRKVILHTVLQRFSSDGRHVSGKELCFLIDSILTSIKDNRKEQNTLCWIAAAHSQRNWTDELILLQLENHFKKQLDEKSKWLGYLSKIENKEVVLLFGAKLGQCGSSISTECVDCILRFLSSITNATVSLDGLKLSEWPYVLKEKYWLCKLLSLTKWQENEKLPIASYYLLSMENTFGADLVEQLLEALKGKKPALTPYVLTDIFANFQNGKWNLSEEEISFLTTNDIGKWENRMQKKFTADKEERNITQLIDLINGNANTSKNILNKLPKIKNYTESIQENSKIHGNTFDSLAEKFREKCAIHCQTFRIKNDLQDKEKEMIALIDRAIELKRGFKLRDTQKLAILALLVNEQNTLAQVSTGEGKSLIVVAAAIMKALRGEKVDIITSSSVLAKRDAEENKDIYELFNIKVSHNCSEEIEERKQAYSGNQVVYGELSNFQRDYLLDKFYGKNILGDRNFENVIVDEVDSMLLDRGNNMLYLSHDLACLDKLESVYVFIWQWINQPAWDEKDISQAFNVEAIEEAVLSDLYGFVRREELLKMGHELTEQQTTNIWTSLVDAQILDDQGKLLKDDIDDDVYRMISPEFSRYRDRLKYLLTEVIDREKRIKVPNHLRSFVERHLKSWIKSAEIAFSMKPGQDYVVDVDRTGTSSDRNPNIVILDRDTGTDQANSQWDDALHQFLQLKHGCRMSLQSLKAVFISNVSYFKLYRKLYGLTGTLGSQSERKLLQEIHKVDFVTVPTFISKQFDEHNPILCSDEEAWINHIREEVLKITETSKRSVLVICETVNDVEVLYKAFGGRAKKNVHMYKRDYEEFDVTDGKNTLEQGQIIIATNLAGRGTDIKPSEGLRKAGGLHVCLTYLPANIRIEQQAFGRAARSGDKGSGQLIIMDSKGKEYSSSRVIDLKKERDAEELYRISDIKSYYETQITMEETCFKLFKEQYERLEKHLDDKKVPTEIKETLMKSCLDRWAFWLDENNKYLGTLIDEQSKNSFNNIINDFIIQLKKLEHSNSWLPWVEGNPAEMIKLAKCLSQTKEPPTYLSIITNPVCPLLNEKLKDAINLFDEVIEMEPLFAEAAHYYKAFTLSKQMDEGQSVLSEAVKQKTLKEFKEELQKAARLFHEHTKFSTNAAGIIANIKKKNTESIIQIEAFEEQQKSIASLYAMLSRSIDDILGHTINPQSFVNADVNEDLAETVYKDLLAKGVIKNMTVKKEIPEKELKTISSGYGLSAGPFLGFISKYGGKEIIQQEFHKVLKTEVPLPSRETFWKLLIDGKVLRKEIKYVAVDIGRLQDINPSVLHSLILLENQYLDLKDGQILLNAEYVSQQQSNGNVFIKHDFIKSVGQDKYKLLKEKGVLSFNRKARLDHSQIKTMTFPYYDSIALEDFAKVNITKNETEQIIATLVANNIVEKKENNAYKLKVKFDEIEEFAFPPYHNAVKGLLSVCFAFRIELQRIEKQLQAKDCPIRLQIKTKPHRDLFWDLYERNIIIPSIGTTEDEGLEETLKRIYSQKMTKKDFKLMLSQDKLISEECTEKLYHCLIEKKWIIEFSPMHRFQNASAEHQVNSDIFSICEINSPDQRQTPLNFSPAGSHGKMLAKSKSIDKEVEQVLNNRLYLGKTETINSIVSTIKRSRIILNISKMPNFQLKPLTKFSGQKVNFEDMHVFSLNGLGHLIQLAGAKWTSKMLLNTAVVAVLGIAQIAIGAALTLFSMGIMHKVGGALIREGINDLNFAVGALKSGYFSWKDYVQFKIHSLMNEATTAGLGAYLSRRFNVSGFGHRLAASCFIIGSNKLAEMYEKKPIANTEKILAKRITERAAEGVSFALHNAGTDTFIDNSLQTLSAGIASSILSHIAQEVERHNISKTLEKAYNLLGEESGRELNNLAKSFLTENYWERKLFPMAYIISKSVVQGIEKAVEKGSESNHKSEFSSQIINLATVWKERVSHLANIKSTTGYLLNDLDKRINEKLDSQQSKTVDPGRNRKRCEDLKREITDQLKNLLCAEAERVISERIASPILSKGANILVKYAEKKSKQAFRSNQECGYFEQSDERKREYQEQMKTNEKN